MSSKTQREVQPSGQPIVVEPLAMAALREHVLGGYPAEVVGILAGQRQEGRVVEIERLVNTRTDRAADRYEVHPLALMKAEQALEDRGLEIVGYYHSHPDHPAMYSDTDRDLALPEMAYLIASVQGPSPRLAELRCWRLRPDGAVMLEDQLSTASPPPTP